MKFYHYYNVLLEDMAEYRDSETLQELLLKIHKKQFSEETLAKSLYDDFSQSSIDDWKKAGLLDFDEQVSFVDFIWTQIVAELDSYGLKTDKIARMKLDIMEPLKIRPFLGDQHEPEIESRINQMPESISYLVVLLVMTIFDRDMLYIFQNRAGASQVLIHQPHMGLGNNFPLSLFNFQSFVAISVTELIIRFIKSANASTLWSDVGILCQDECELLSNVQAGNVSNVEIHVEREIATFDFSIKQNYEAEIQRLIESFYHAEYSKINYNLQDSEVDFRFKKPRKSAY